MKDLRKANLSLIESAEESSKAFDKSSNNLQLEYNKFFDSSVETTR